jgi:hypothetical protein
MLKFLHTKSLKNSYSEIRQLLAVASFSELIDVRRELDGIIEFASRSFPHGINTPPCAATRAFCVDLVRTATKAASSNMIALYVACSLVNIYFSAWDLEEKARGSSDLASLRTDAKAAIDKILKDERP